MLTDTEAVQITAAYLVAQNLGQSGIHSEDKYAGYIAAHWEAAQEAIFNALNVSNVYGDDPNAARVLRRIVGKDSPDETHATS